MTVQWSHSRLETFKQCPKRFYHQYIAKDVVDDGPVHPTTLWGQQVHKAIEDRIKDGTPLPENMTQYSGFVEACAALPGVQAEVQFAITTQWTQTDWFAADVWGRCIIDVLAYNSEGTEAYVADWKLGKYRGDTGQARVNAMMLLATDPKLEKVNTQFIYLAAKKIDTQTFTRDKLVEYAEPTIDTVRQIETCKAKEAWHPTPTGLCGYCPVTRCQFNRRK